MIRFVLRLAALWVLLFPFLLGGRDDTARDLTGIVVCLCAALAAVSQFKSKNVRAVGKLSRLLLLLAFAGLILVAAQLIPVPLSFLTLVSPRVAALYEKAGALTGSLSIDRSLGAEGVYWFAVLSLGFFSFLRLPVVSQQDGDFEPRRDYISESLQGAIILSGVICAITALFHWALKIDPLFGIWGQERPFGSGERAHWPFVNPNHLATFLQISILVALTQFFVSRWERRSHRTKGSRGQVRMRTHSFSIASREVALLFGSLLMGLALLLTLSRAGISACLLGIVLLWGYALKQSRSQSRVNPARRWLAGAGWGAAIALLLLFLLGGTGRDLLASRVEYGLNADFDQNRRNLVIATLQLIADYPLFGTGLGTWHLAVAPYLTLEMSGWTLDFAHNDYLQLFSETGVFVFFLLSTAIVGYLVRLKRALRLPPTPEARIEIVGLSVALLVPMLHASLDFPFHIPAILFLFILLLALAVRVIEAAFEAAGSADVLSDVLES